MVIHCIHCGAELPDIANVCLICGKPSNGTSPSAIQASSKAEYKQIHLDLSQQPFIEYATMGVGSLRPQNDFAKGQADMAARERIMQMLKSYLNDGWELDGTFNSAVDIVWKDIGKFLSFKGRLTGAAVKLRRYL